MSPSVQPNVEGHMANLIGTAIIRALNIHDLTPHERLVLVKLAQYEDVHGVATLSVDRIAKETGLSRRGVFRVIDRLELRDLVLRTTVAGLKTTVYRLFLGVGEAPSDASLALSNVTQAPSDAPLSPTDGVVMALTGAPVALNGAHVALNGVPVTHQSCSTVPGRHPNTSTSIRASTNSKKDVPTVHKATASPGGAPVRRTGLPSNTLSVSPWKEPTLPTPGFDDEAPAKKPKRGTKPIDDLASVGKLEVTPSPPATAEKPLDKWNSRDFRLYLSTQTAIYFPTLIEQIPVGWSQKDFKRWLEDVSPDVVKKTIDMFFGDKQNLLDLSGTTVWQRYRTFFIKNQSRAQVAIERATMTTEDVPEALRSKRPSMFEHLRKADA